MAQNGLAEPNWRNWVASASAQTDSRGKTKRAGAWIFTNATWRMDNGTGCVPCNNARVVCYGHVNKARCARCTRFHIHSNVCRIAQVAAAANAQPPAGPPSAPVVPPPGNQAGPPPVMAGGNPTLPVGPPAPGSFAQTLAAAGQPASTTAAATQPGSAQGSLGAPPAPDRPRRSGSAPP